MVNKAKQRSKFFVGIDISKEWFDVAISAERPEAAKPEIVRYPNTAEGCAALIAALRGHAIVLIVLEATGGYERLARRALQEAGWPVLCEHPNRIHAFAKACGRLAKTDTIDAAILAGYAAFTSRPPKPIARQTQLLRDLQARRLQLTAMLHAEQCRKGQAEDAGLRTALERMITTLKAEIVTTDARMDEIIEQCDELRARRQLLRSLKGVGPRTANAIIAALPEIGAIGNKQIAALVGVAPINRDSGKKTGRAHIAGGRSMVRHPLYMAAVCAARYNPAMKDFYQRLTLAGKPAKLALTAIMRRMIVILNAIIRSGQPWKGALA